MDLLLFVVVIAFAAIVVLINSRVRDERLRRDEELIYRQIFDPEPAWKVETWTDPVIADLPVMYATDIDGEIISIDEAFQRGDVVVASYNAGKDTLTMRYEDGAELVFRRRSE